MRCAGKLPVGASELEFVTSIPSRGPAGYLVTRHAQAT